MATTLYTTLEIDATATPEEIRRAYKRKALKTHPDRLPPTASLEEKKLSEESFRAVNHAYEILIDPQKRKEYDYHGVWPPPDNDTFMRSSGSRAQQDPFNHPFFQHHHHPFTFTDPFALFDSIFGEFPQSRGGGFNFSGSWAFGSGHRHGRDPFDMFMEDDDDFTGPGGSVGFGFGFGPAFLRGGIGMSHTSSFGSGGSGWVSESFQTQMINGVSQSVHTRRDSQGNEHVTRTLPDGRQVYSINGVEQRPQQAIQGATTNSRPTGIQGAPVTSRVAAAPTAHQVVDETRSARSHHSRNGDVQMRSPSTANRAVNGMRPSSSDSHHGRLRERDVPMRSPSLGSHHPSASSSRQSTRDYRNTTPQYSGDGHAPLHRTDLETASYRDHHRTHRHRSGAPAPPPPPAPTQPVEPQHRASEAHEHQEHKSKGILASTWNRLNQYLHGSSHEQHDDHSGSGKL